MEDETDTDVRDSTTDSHEETDTNFDRRTFLKRSAGGALGVAGWAAQDDPPTTRVTRRMAFRKSGRLDEEYVRKIVLLTDRKDENPDVSEVAGCEFDDWPTDG